MNRAPPLADGNKGPPPFPTPGHRPSTTLRARGAETRTWETTLRLQSLLYGGPWLRAAARVAPEPFHQPKNEARDPPRGKAQARPCHSRSGSKKGQLLSLLFLPIQQIKNAAQRNQLLRNRCPSVGHLSGNNNQGPKPRALSPRLPPDHTGSGSYVASTCAHAPHGQLAEERPLE